MPPKAVMYDDDKIALLDEFFAIDNMHMIRSVTTSGNSYGVEACRYIGDKLVAAKNLRTITFSDMSTTRLKTQLPQSLKFMIDAVMDK